MKITAELGRITFTFPSSSATFEEYCSMFCPKIAETLNTDDFDVYPGNVKYSNGNVEITVYDQDINEDSKRFSRIEKSILENLSKAWNMFAGLTTSHPDDQNEFRLHMHALQQIMATRLVRRLEPEVFPIKS